MTALKAYPTLLQGSITTVKLRKPKEINRAELLQRNQPCPELLPSITKPGASLKRLSSQRSKKLKIPSPKSHLIRCTMSSWTGESASALAISCQPLLRWRLSVWLLLRWEPTGASHALLRFPSRPANSHVNKDSLDLSITTGGSS